MARPKGTTRETIATSVRLTPLCVSLWEALATHAGLNKTAYLESTIRRLAKEDGVDLDKKDKEND